MCTVAHNEDNSHTDRNRTALVVARFGSQPAFHAYTYLGDLPSGAFAFNDAGIGFTLNYVGPTRPRCPGLARGFFSRSLLDARSLDEAVRAITDARGAGGHNYQLFSFGGSRDPRVINVETAPGGEHAVRRIGSTPFFHANQYTALAVPQLISNSSAHRTARAAELLPRIAATKAAAMSAALRNAIGDQHDRSYPIYHDELSHARGDLSDWTIASATFDLHARKMRIYRGNPQKDAVLLELPLESA